MEAAFTRRQYLAYQALVQAKETISDDSRDGYTEQELDETFTWRQWNAVHDTRPR